MAEKLGILLVRKQLVTPEQVEEAAKLQVIYGGRIGTNLIELGYLDLESLASVLAEQRRVPAVTLAELDAATQATLDLIPAALAEKHMAFPLRVDRRSLHVAMASPFDFETVDALGFATGYRIVPKICPELRLLYYLEKRYGLERKARYIRLADDRPPARPPPQAAGTGVVDRRKYLTATPELAQPAPARELDSALKPLGAGEYLTSEEDDLYSQSGGSLSPNIPTAAPVAPPAAPPSPSAARRAALGISPGQVPVARTVTPSAVPVVAPPLASPPALAPSEPPTHAPQPAAFAPQPPTLAPQTPAFAPQPPTLAPPAPAFAPQPAAFAPQPPTLAPPAPAFAPQAPPVSPQAPAPTPQPLSPSAARRAALGLGAAPATTQPVAPAAPPLVAPPQVAEAPPVLLQPSVPPPAIAPALEAPPAIALTIPAPPPVNVVVPEAASPFGAPLEPDPEPEELEAVDLEPLAEEVPEPAPVQEIEPEPFEELAVAIEETPEPPAPLAPSPLPSPVAPAPVVAAPVAAPEPIASAPSLVPLAAADGGDLATMQWDMAFDAPPPIPTPAAPAAATPPAIDAPVEVPAAAPEPELAVEVAPPEAPGAAPAEPVAASVEPAVQAAEVSRSAGPAEAAVEAAQPAEALPAPEVAAPTGAAPPEPAASPERSVTAPPASAPADSAPPAEAAPAAEAMAEPEFAPTDADAAFLAAFDASRAAAAAETPAEAEPQPASLEMLAIPEPASDADAPREPEPEPRSPPGMLLVEEVLARASDRDKLADALSWFAEGRFAFNLILVVRGNIGAGWHGFGPGLDRAFIERLHVPLDQPSILTAAIEARAAIVREQPETSLDRRLLAYCGLHPRSSLVAFPIFARERLVNVVLGSRGSWPLRENIADEANRVASAVGRAYERLLLLRKRIDD